MSDYDENPDIVIKLQPVEIHTPNAVEVRVSGAYGAELEAVLEEGGVKLGKVIEHSADTDTWIWLISSGVAAGGAGAVLKQIVPLVQTFVQRHSHKRIEVHSGDQKYVVAGGSLPEMKAIVDDFERERARQAEQWARIKEGWDAEDRAAGPDEGDPDESARGASS